jgi:hypothetical protein
MISSIAQILGIVPPRPNFELFQPVRSHYIEDDYRNLDDTGIVIGIFYSPGLKAYGFDAGWFCVVYWLSMPSSPHLPAPYVNEVRQEDLRAIEQI